MSSIIWLVVRRPLALALSTALTWATSDKSDPTRRSRSALDLLDQLPESRPGFDISDRVFGKLSMEHISMTDLSRSADFGLRSSG